MSYHVAVSLRRVMGGRVSRPDLRGAALRSTGRPAARRPPTLCGEARLPACRGRVERRPSRRHAVSSQCRGARGLGSAVRGSSAVAGL